MSDIKPQGTQSYGVESGYERSDANTTSVMIGLLIVFSGTFVCMATVYQVNGFFARKYAARDAALPATYTRKINPPLPRLLPSPYTDTYAKVAMIGRRTNEAGLTPDGNPWDKRQAEIYAQYAEANSYGHSVPADGPAGAETNRIPVARAMELEAGVTEGGTPAIMPFQADYASLEAGTRDGAMNLVPGEKTDSRDTFDQRARWDSPDEKFTADSASGTNLHAGEMSR